MSKFSTIKTQFKNNSALLSTLKTFGFHDIMVGEKLPMHGYHGDVREETAEIVIDRKYIGSASNDLGFKRTPDGYQMIISEYDQRFLKKGKFVSEFTQAYAKTVIMNELKLMEFNIVSETTNEFGEIEISVRRF